MITAASSLLRFTLSPFCWYHYLLACVWDVSHDRREGLESRDIRYFTQCPKEEIHVANIKSQIKRITTNRKAQERNKAVKSELKSTVRTAREAIATGDKEKATTAAHAAARKLDKAVSKGVIHRNQAANRKSAIAKQVAAL